MFGCVAAWQVTVLQLTEVGDYEAQNLNINECLIEEIQFILALHLWLGAVMCRFSSQILIKMETYQNYNGYGITYSSMTGTTKVDKYGFTIQVFSRMGEQKGLELAKSYIDKICCGVVS
jgi:glycogen synthase